MSDPGGKLRKMAIRLEVTCARDVGAIFSELDLQAHDFFFCASACNRARAVCVRANAPLRVRTRSATGSQGIKSDLRFSLQRGRLHAHLLIF